jgi:predicted PhzF superfamily epimerase YddE/YHI9
MMKLSMYQVDAFTEHVFGGNPAAVCPLDKWLSDDVMLSIAAENNLAETAFFVQEEDGFRLRWFTPVAEVDLCGHATLASADVLFRQLGFIGESIRFETRSGLLIVRCHDDLYSMDFPATVPAECPIPDALVEGLGKKPQRVFKAFDYIAEFGSGEEICSLKPDFAKLSQIDLRGVCVTAPGENCDFVSRFFAPKLGINEDPVTGSAHCELTPLWSQLLGKTKLTAIQISPRRGNVLCELRRERVVLSGRAAHYMTAEINVPLHRPGEDSRAGQAG